MAYSRERTKLLGGDDLGRQEIVFSNPAKPQAYLNYVLFEENGNIYSEGSGRFQADGDGEWKRIGTGEGTLVMQRNGYLAVYLSNASTGGSAALPGGNDGDVFFDLLNMELLRGVLMEENHHFDGLNASITPSACR